MFYHEDLAFYTDKRVRSYDYIISALNVVEKYIISYCGMCKSACVTICIDDDSVYINITSNYNHVFSKFIQKSTGHMLEALEGFTIEVSFEVFFDSKISTDDCSYEANSCFYYSNSKSKSEDFDHGIVETFAFYKGNFESFELFKNQVIE